MSNGMIDIVLGRETGSQRARCSICEKDFDSVIEFTQVREISGLEHFDLVWVCKACLYESLAMLNGKVEAEDRCLCDWANREYHSECPEHGLNVAVTKTPGVQGGDPCLGDTRIRVEDVAAFWEMGGSDEMLLAAYPILTQRHLDAVKTYLVDHSSSGGDE